MKVPWPFNNLRPCMGFHRFPLGKNCVDSSRKIGAVVLRMIPSDDIPANFDSLHCLHGAKTTLFFFSMTSWCYSNIYLVGDLEHVFSPYIGNFIIPTDELIFFRGVGIGIGVAARVPHELLRDPAVNPSGHIVGGAHGSFSWCSSHCHLIG